MGLSEERSLWALLLLLVWMYVLWYTVWCVAMKFGSVPCDAGLMPRYPISLLMLFQRERLSPRTIGRSLLFLDF